MAGYCTVGNRVLRQQQQQRGPLEEGLMTLWIKYRFSVAIDFAVVVNPEIQKAAWGAKRTRGKAEDRYIG